MLIEFFAWWYGKGWLEAGKQCLAMIKAAQLSFSIPELLKTLFAPWKRIITFPGRSLDEKMRAALDNLVSRTIGFFVRIFAILAALVFTAITAFVAVVVTLLWPLIPLLIIYCFVRGFTG